MITGGCVYLIRHSNGREVSATTRMTASWQAILEREGHEVFEFPFELPGPATLPSPPPSAHGCWEDPGMEDS